jgi:hypothetical protein
VSGRDPGPRESARGLRESVNGMPLCVYVRLYSLSGAYQGEPVAFINIWLHLMVGLVEGLPAHEGWVSECAIHGHLDDGSDIELFA